MRRQGPKHTFGWDVFNEDTLYEAYKKKCRSMPFNEVQYQQPADAPLNAQLVDNLVE